MTTTEERLAAALSARAGGITMDSSTMDRRFAQVQERGVQDRRRRRRVVAGAGALAVAASVIAALAFGGGLLDSDDTAVPEFAERQRAQIGEPFLVGRVSAVPGTTYSAQQFSVPFTFSVPPLDGVPGTWSAGAGGLTYIGLDSSPSTAHANVTLAVVDQVYDPASATTPDAPLVGAPQDADGWQRWLEQTGAAEVTDREELEVGGLPATRLTVDVAGDLPSRAFPCAPGESCLPLGPDGPSLVGETRTAGAGFSELTVLEVDGRTVLVTTIGAEQTADEWLPLMHAVVESLRFA